MNKRLSRGIAFTMLASSLGLVWLVVKEPSTSVSPAADNSTASPSVSAPTRSVPEKLNPADPLAVFSIEEQQFALQLRKRFGERIKHPYWQLKLIDELIRYYQEKFPNDWHARLLKLLPAIFPELAAKLQTMFMAYTDYNEWITHLGSMQFFSPDQRNQTIWDKRVALFGQDAYLIWEGEFKKQQLDKTLAQLKDSYAPLANKMDTYLKALDSAYGANARNPEKANTTQFMEDFLSLDSVQRDLRKVSPEEQKNLLREFRTEIGLNKEALVRWDELDSERARRRAEGDAYMRERAKLEQQKLPSNILQGQVEALQNRLLEEQERQFIKNEEASGYYRFKEAQIIGVN